MKSKIFKSLMLILCLPIVMISFCACARKPLDNYTYFNEVKAVLNNSSGNMADLTLDDISASGPNMEKVNNYYSIDINAEPEWIYKMYIEKITFSIFIKDKIANANEITFTLTISNAIAENNVGKDYDDELTDDDKKFVATSSIVPTENGYYDLSFDVGYVLGFLNAQTGSKISVDISEYDLGGAGTSTGNISPLNWTIYNFKAYGESRAYN